MSIQDPDIASIVTTRIAQVTIFAEEAETLFDRGLKIVEKRPIKKEDFENYQDPQAMYEQEKKIRHNEKEQAFKWLKNCGDNNEDLLDGAFTKKGKWNRVFTLKEYMQSQSRNILVLGRAARENIWSNTEDKPMLTMFRPLPVEQIRPLKYRHNNQVTVEDFIERESDFSKQEAEKYNKKDIDERNIIYAQVYNDKVVAVFPEGIVSMCYYQRQSNFEYQAYPLSPIEQAVATIYLNNNVHSHLVNKFRSGLLARSMMVIRPTGKDDLDGKLSNSDLRKFKTTLTQMSRTENSGAIPIMSGPYEVQLVDLNPKTDNEWQDLKNNIKRSLCSAFQISPSEVSWGQLGDTSNLSSQNENAGVELGEERGLRILLDVLMEDLNGALANRFPWFSEKYKLSYQGVGSETKDVALNRLTTEANLTATMNDLLNKSNENASVAFGGDVPLSPLFHQNVVRYMKMGEFREHFLGEVDASKKPEYDFFIEAAFENLRMQKITEQLNIDSQQVGLDKAKIDLEISKVELQQMQAQAQQPQQPQQGQGQQPAPQQNDNQEQPISQPQQEKPVKPQ